VKSKNFPGASPRIPKKAQNREGRGRSKHREEEGRWREGRVGWGRKGRGTEREGNGGEGKKGGKGGEEKRGKGRAGKWKERELGGGEVCVMVFGGMDAPDRSQTIQLRHAISQIHDYQTTLKWAAPFSEG
jgi:hypothetical protein